jgi:hypothetical protein
MNAQIKKSNGKIVNYEFRLTRAEDGRFAWSYKPGYSSFWKSPSDPFGSFNKLRGYLINNE